MRDRFSAVDTVMDIRLCLFVSLLYSWSVSGNLLSTDKRLPLTVEMGRSAFLTKAHIPIDTKLKVADLCQVEVDDVQPFSSALGVLKPKKFPCFFEPNTVIYQHEGSPLLFSDTVLVNIYFFRKQYSAVQNVSIQISIIPTKTPQRVNLKSHLTVKSSKGVSEALSSDILTIKFDMNKEFCRMRHFNQAAASTTLYPWLATRHWPLTGLLITFNKTKVFEFNQDCQQALLMGYRFMHRKSRSASVDFLPLVIEISNIDDKVVTDRTYLQIPIFISSVQSLDLFKNLLPPPVVETFRTVLLKNSGGTISLLPKDVLEVRSQDRNRGPLIAKIVSIQGNDVAKFVNMRDPSKDILSFTLTDLEEGLIGFQLLSYSETVEKIFRVDLMIYDSYFVHSAPVILKIVDELDNKNHPFQVFTTPFYTFTANVRPLRYNNIQIVGQVDHSLIKYRFLNINVVHGSFYKNPSTNLFSKDNDKSVYFSMVDVKKNDIFYKHHSGLENVDILRIEASIDRFRFIRFYLPIYVVRMYNRSKERLLTGVTEFLTPTEGLMPLPFPKLVNWVYYYHIQRDNIEISFSILKETKHGVLLRLISWENVSDSSVLKTSFSVQDLVNGLLYYKSNPSSSNNKDVIELQQIGRDGSDIMKIIFNIRLYVTNFLIPKMDPNIIFKVLETNQFSRLSYLNLNFVNHNLQPHDIVYHILRCPVYEQMSMSADSGRLISLKSIQSHLLIGDTTLTTKITDYRSAQITSVITFTQQQILDNDIVYVPPADDVGPLDRHVQFLYSVTDSYGYEIRNLPFSILLKAVNDKSPFVRCLEMTVPRDEDVYLSTTNIEVNDVDTLRDKLDVEIVQLPIYGRLISGNNDVVSKGFKFNATGLADKYMRYKHDGHNVQKDHFKIRVFDGVQYSPTYDVVINITKRIIANSSWNLYINNSIIVKENMTVSLHLNAFKSVMKDFDLNIITNPTFILVTMPTRGNLLKDGNVISTFYYEEVKSGQIVYKHTVTEIGSKAQFDFTQIWILESGESFTMNFTILPVNSQSPVIYSQSPLQINEGGSGVVSFYTLGVVDVDSREVDLRIKVVRPPIWGKICSGVDRTVTNAFSVADIRLGKILYVNHRFSNGLEQTSDVFSVQAFDEEFASPQLEISVVIHPVNDETPKILLRDFNIAVGENRTFDESIFQVSDDDIPRDALLISVTKFPTLGNLSTLYKHGELKVISKYSPPLTLQMMRFVSILYTQNRGKIANLSSKFPLKDEFELTASDGVHRVFKTCFVNITGLNVRPPEIFTSLIQLNQVAEKNVSSLELRAKDDDTLPQDVVFTLTSAPTKGDLVVEGVKLKSQQRFTQRHIDDGSVKYRYAGKAVSYEKDSFSVTVFDGSFQTKTKVIYVFMTQPIQKPRMVVSIDPIKVEIGLRFVLDRGIFTFKNPITDLSSLIITVTRKPTCGSLYYFTNLQNAVTKFTVDDVEKRKILFYISECPDVVKFMNIPLVIFHQQTFKQTLSLHVQILPRSNLPPVLEKNDVLKAVVGSNVILTKESLSLSDQDTASDKINFRYLKENDSSIVLFVNDLESDAFTQYDVNSQNVVVSLPDHLNSTEEVLRLRVSDGYNEGYVVNSNLQLPGIVIVSILVSQWIHKDLILLRFSSPKEMRFIDGHNSFPWTFNNLLVSRPEARITSAMDLVAGFFFNIKTKQSVKYFTQIDINRGWIHYFLIKERSSMVHREVFQFRIFHEEFRISSEKLSLNWSILEFDRVKYKLCPQTGLLSVIVLRRGDVSVESQALVGFVSKEAIIDQDYRLLSQRLLIFTPGQTNTTVSIKILLSGSVKTPSRFMVTLKSPRQAVIGAKSTTLISIKDRNTCGSRQYFWPEKSLKNANENVKIKGVRDMVQDYNLDIDTSQDKNYLPSSDQLESQYSDYLQSKKTTSKCIKGWQTYWKRCYKQFTMKVSWKDANSKCTELDSYLVSIPSEKIASWLMKLFGRPQSFWIGLHRPDSTNEWRYTNNEAMSFSNWDPGFPKRSGRKQRHCVVVARNMGWRNRPCGKKRNYFVCMKNPQVLI